MEKDNSTMIFHKAEFAQLDPKQSAPEFNYVRGKEWIPYVTVDGVQYPDKLIDLYNNSALHGAILQSKIDQVSGNGFIWDEPDSSILEESEMTYFMDNINSDEDANELLWKMTSDLEVFGGIALQITWTANWEKIGSIRHLDFSKVRANKVNDDGKVPGYYTNDYVYWLESKITAHNKCYQQH